MLLVERGLAESRERAQALVRAGVVYSGEQRVDKPGTTLPRDCALDVRRDPCPYVSRGGLKLEAALNTFNLDPRGAVALDIGASTGGFTDCLLQRGAAEVYAIDVGTAQLHWKLRQDSRVHCHEQVNARTLAEEQPRLFAEVQSRAPTVAVGDVSFISLRLVLPTVQALLAPGGWAVFLVKPQFEVGREAVGRGGIVRDAATRERALAGVVDFATASLGWTHLGAIDSPIAGAKGNLEYLAAFKRE